MISLKPVDFFERSPAIDLPPSTQHVNRSTAYKVNGQNGNGNGVAESATCCAK